MKLPDCFLDRPVAHRGLHDAAQGVAENSATAFQRAIAHGYGIELDCQLSSDAQAMVFHDYDMRRLTARKGAIQLRTCDDLSQTPLNGSSDTILDLPSILKLIDGQVPVLIELKDQDGAMGPDVGKLEHAVTQALSRYDGPVAVMSFNPNSTERMAELAPTLPRGIVTSAYDPDIWPLSKELCATLRAIPDYDRTGASFISHEATDLHRDRVAELKAKGARILCWTITSQAQEIEARRVADNITFENYLPT